MNVCSVPPTPTYCGGPLVYAFATQQITPCDPRRCSRHSDMVHVSGPTQTKARGSSRVLRRVGSLLPCLPFINDYYGRHHKVLLPPFQPQGPGAGYISFPIHSSIRAPPAGLHARRRVTTGYITHETSHRSSQNIGPICHPPSVSRNGQDSREAFIGARPLPR